MTSTKKPLNVQTLMSATVMADLVRFLKLSNIPHKSSYSHVASLILEGTWKTWDCSHFTDSESALQFLQSEGFSVAQLRDPKRGPRLLRTLNAEALVSEHSVSPPTDSARAAELAELMEPPDAET